VDFQTACHIRAAGQAGTRPGDYFGRATACRPETIRNGSFSEGLPSRVPLATVPCRFFAKLFCDHVVPAPVRDRLQASGLTAPLCAAHLFFMQEELDEFSSEILS